ncbi:NAD(P)-dependent oxidoreductase [Porphyromonas sp. COT-239 OH1446]|uniref:NAD-dependent epimerase/dehydratase family protein n=1 Tax=Porphyromonas sp. COT-239 OH1446 TaxID=1515613 RepID=UPI00052D12BC|nr:NAD(P)-dependent oxidoreductase [Porphyromonas sp. COT-239 OH1446]KGN71689.1 NAD-binding protein [Porphyromonas sp. COT-239 OH1446]
MNRQSKQTILLTGAAGNIGREVLRMLVAQGDRYHIRVLELKNARSMALFDKYRGRIEIYYADLSQLDQLQQATRGVDWCIHTASIIPPRAYEERELTYRVNVLGTANLIASLEKHSPKAFIIVTSSVAVYGDRLQRPNIRVTDQLQTSEGDNYGSSKIHMEQIVRSSKLGWTIFRLSAIMGVGNHKISKLIFHMPLDTQMEITTLGDTARALTLAIEHRSELERRIFNLGGGAACRTTYREFLSKNFELYGLGALDFPDKAFAERNYHCGLYADGDKLEEILGFRQDSLEDYYATVKASIPAYKRWGASLLKGEIKRRLLNRSEPYRAWVEQDEMRMEDFF